MSQKLYFAAGDINGYDSLWVTDGTTTTEVGGIGNQTDVLGSTGEGLQPTLMTAFGDDSVIFGGFNTSGSTNTQPWVSDGTTSGTTEITGVTDGDPIGLNPSDDFYTFNYGRDALFFGLNKSSNPTLWFTNGTASDTLEVDGAGNANVPDRNTDWQPSNFAAFNDEMLFDARDANSNIDLWITNGTTAQEIGGSDNHLVADAPSTGLDAAGGTFVQLGNLMLFEANDAAATNDPNALWVTDGTAAGTYEIGGAGNAGVSGANKNVGLGAGLANAVQFGDRVLFQGRDNGGAMGLWVTDGTASGTFEIDGAANGGPANGVDPLGLEPTDLTSALTVNGQEVLFNGVDSSSLNNLWVTDGTAGGTKEIGGPKALLTDEAAEGLNPTSIVSLGNGKSVFVGMDSSSNGSTGKATLWVTDGTAAGTSEIGGLNNQQIVGNKQAGEDAISPLGFNFNTPGDSQLIGGDGYAYFIGQENSADGNDDFVLWQTDGTVGGTHVVTASGQPITGLNPQEFALGSVPSSQSTVNGGAVTLANMPDNEVTVTENGATATTITGSNGTINLELATAAAYGAGLLISLLDSAIDLYNTTLNNKDTVSFKGAGASSVTLHGAQANVVGGGQTITFATGTTGNYVNIEDTEGKPDTVNGSNGAVVLANAQANIYGGSDTITLDGSSADYANLFNTSANFDTVIGSGGKVGLNSAVAAILGGSDTITLDGSSSDWANLFNTGANFDTVIGSGGKVGLNSSVAAVLGGSDTITLDGSSSDYANLFNTGANFDTVLGSHGKVGLNSAVAAVIGGSDTITLDGSSTDYANLFSTGANFDTVIGSHGKVGLNGAVAAVLGGSDTIALDGSSTDYANLFNTGANFDTVLGSGGKIGLNSAVAAVIGGSDTITLDGSSTDYANLFNTGAKFDTVLGSGGKVGLNSAVAAVLGGSDTITLDGSSTDYANLFNTGANFDTVIGSGGKIGLNSAVAAVIGGSDTITLDGSSTDYANLFSTGANSDTVIGSSGKVGLNSVVAAVDGNSDEVDFNGGSNSAALNGTGEAFVFAAKFGLDTISGAAGSDGYFFSKSDFADFNALQAKMTSSGANNTLITLDAGDTVTLLGVNMNNLNQIQFHFL